MAPDYHVHLQVDHEGIFEKDWSGAIDALHSAAWTSNDLQIPLPHFLTQAGI